MDDAYDLIVIGAGNAGQAAAAIARAAGWRVAIIEARDVGGTCPLRGCVPKKVLAAASEVADLVRRAPALSIDVGPQALDWTALIARERTFVDGVPAAMKDDLLRQGIDVIEGRARFVDPHAISVSGRGAPLRARKFLVATGSVPRALPFPGGDRLLTSDDLLELATLPPSVAFVGAGVIAFELGHVMARAGARVTLLESAPRALPGHDAGAVDWLIAASAARGIDVRVGVDVRSVGDAPDGTRLVRYDVRADSGQPQELRVHAVAHGAGRVADLDTLDLAAAGVETDGVGPRLDDAHCSRSNPDVWFAGDAVPGKPQLSALATYEGRLVARNLISGESQAPDYALDPQRGLHHAGPGVGGTDRRGGARTRPDLRGPRQRHARPGARRAPTPRSSRGRRCWSIAGPIGWSARTWSGTAPPTSSTRSRWRCVTASPSPVSSRGSTPTRHSTPS